MTPALGNDQLATLEHVCQAILDDLTAADLGRRERVAYMQSHRVICLGCGCLCWDNEPCPGCRSRQKHEYDKTEKVI